MLLNEQELKALNFILDYAEQQMSFEGCNDLTEEQIEEFKYFKVFNKDNPEFEEPKTNFDIIQWIRRNL